MKKILFAILAAAAMSAACTQFEEDNAPAYDTAAKPEVSATVVSDTEITVTVTAGAGTNFWGYAVMTGAPGATADKLVANGYAKDGAVVVQGEAKTPQAAQLKYSEETKTVTLNLTGLTPYTDYTVYAAAVTAMGVTSEVAEMTVKTTDGTEPVANPAGAAFQESEGMLMFSIPFNDPIALTGNGTAKAYFYAENYIDAEGNLVLYKEVEIPATHMAANGKSLILAVPASECIPGAYVSMTYSADIVVNAAGATNVAFDKHSLWYEGSSVKRDGIVGYYDYANWDFSLVDPSTLPDEPEEGEGEMEGEEEEEEEVKGPEFFQDWTSLVMRAYGSSKYDIVTDTDDTDIQIKVVEMGGKTVTYSLPASNFAAIGSNVIGMMLSEAPAFGSSISYTIAEGSFADIFGNVNNAFTAEDEYYCSYGYSVNDVVGEYTISGINLWTGAPLTYPMAVAVSDNPESGNVMITNYFGIEGKLYCDFNVHAGQFTIPEGVIFAPGYASWFNQAGDQVFDYAPGRLSSSTAYVIVATVEGNSLTGYAKDKDGNNIGLANFVATKK
ncbi:MAG: fibronectin type III domain-containing protein [Bacteroidales bacterium]|nr:fibronectin type III domain-containing protein [Bacteroidales bacterium]